MRLAALFLWATVVLSAQVKPAVDFFSSIDGRLTNALTGEPALHTGIVEKTQFPALNDKDSSPRATRSNLRRREGPIHCANAAVRWIDVAR
jgi:hypothetical protein